MTDVTEPGHFSIGDVLNELRDEFPDITISKNDGIVSYSTIVAIGESRPLVRAALEDTVPVHEAASMAEAVDAAFDAASPGGTVLLAPACSSFDMFRDYAERGRSFKAEVSRLAEERGIHR